MTAAGLVHGKHRGWHVVRPVGLARPTVAHGNATGPGPCSPSRALSHVWLIFS